jgi:Xaa-Pro aminopeptidase
MNEFEQRLLKVQKAMRTNRIDSLIVFSDEWRQGNVRYLSNFRALTFYDGNIWSPAIVLIPPEGDATLFVPDFQTLFAQQVSTISDIKPIASFASEIERLRLEVAGAVRSVGVEGLDIMPFSIFKTIEQSLHGVALERSTILRELRRIKSNWEIEMLQKAGEVTDEGMLAAIHAIREGVSEREIAVEAEKAIRSAGCDLSFTTMVGVGANSSNAERRPGDNKVARGDCVLLDLGAMWHGYAGDLSRGVAFGPIPKEYRDIMAVVVEGSRKAVSAVRPGVKVSDIDRASRDVVEQAGYGKYFIHGAVHGTGLDTEEEPFSPDTVIEANMTFVVMCAVYIPQKMGIRLEDSLAATETGPKLFNHVRQEIIVP